MMHLGFWTVLGIALLVGLWEQQAQKRKDAEDYDPEIAKRWNARRTPNCKNLRKKL